ncbi:MAG: hypothetical protein IKQ28_08660 [Lachnospiraceae bacterium]|jgi:hypothetical protein|nr:hypothetical protein [Lachnospiraceae bacterium]MBR4278494.1 hypothetical protein [Lachnospiraceae bacterium]MBR6303954.1 hypothetical protein [Lachnospiraceae bacterium]MBR6910142.1 hypothetical protein [Lachnospiraceae bacterium]
MGINGINDYSNFINNYRIPSIPSVSVDEVKRQDEELKKVSSSPALNNTLEDVAISAKPRNDAALEDISLTFNKGDDYGYIGKDSDIYSLDVENAISDMQKDNVLKQYQFFVGNTGTGALVDNADGVVIPKVYSE